MLDGIFYIITYLYITVQEEGSLFWKVTVLVMVRKKIQMNMFVILNGYRTTFVCTSGTNSVRFLFLVLDVERSFKKDRRIHKTNRSFAFWMLLLMKINSDKQHAILFTRVARCRKFEGSIFEHLL